MSDITVALSEKLKLIGYKGRAASRDLEAARRHQDSGEPRDAVGRGVSVYVRAALDSVFRYADQFVEPNPWQQKSQAVIRAKRRYVRSIETPGDAPGPLDELLACIDQLEELGKNEDKKALKRAVALIVKLKGAQASPDDLAPAKRIARLHGKASEYVHDGCTEDQSRRLLSEVEDALWTVFRPPDLPGARLSALARQADPSDEVVREVNELLASARDLEAFLELVPTPVWLQRLNQGARPLDPLDQSGGRWIAWEAVVRLSKDYRAEAVKWVMEIFERHKGDTAVCVSLASALLDMEPPAIAESLDIVRRHPDGWMLLFGVLDALRDGVDPSSILVKDAADVFLSTLLQGREDSNPALHGGREDNYYMALLGMLSGGATPDNAAGRLEMLAYKLEIARRHWRPSALDRMVAEVLGDESVEMSSNRWMFPLGYSCDAPVSRLGERDLDDFGVKAVSAISTCLVRIFQSAIGGLPASTLLELAARVPEPLGHRLGVWALSVADDADPEDMVRAIESAIASRLPNCDDIALIDRVVSSSKSGDEDVVGCVGRWQAALGEPPILSEVEEAIGSDSIWAEYGWLYPYQWVPLLPEDAASNWTGSNAYKLLAAEQSPRGRADFDEIANKSLRPEVPIRSGPLQPRFDADELGCMAPADAAREIASCPVARDEWTCETLILGRVLQELVEANPSGWGDNPTHIAELLRHPTYISHYLTALSALESEQMGSTDIDSLVDTIVWVLGEPRPVEDLGGESPHSNLCASDWDEAHRAAIWLVRRLLVTKIGLAGRYQEVWDLLEREAKAFPLSQMSADDMEISPLAVMLHSDDQHKREEDLHHLAINQQNTQALDTALLLAVHEHRTSSQVRSQAPALVKWCLAIPGEEGAKYRAIIAARVEFLLHALPDWLEENKDDLFDNDVLGRIALDQVLRFEWPYEWICTNYRRGVYDAAHRGVDRALNWILIAMLNSTEGYEPESVIEQLGNRVPAACEVLAWLLDYSSTGEDTMKERADRFFELLLEGNRHTRALGWLVRTDTMPHDEWVALTLKAMEATGGEIDMSELIIRRVFNNEPKEDSIRILTSLIEVQCNPAHALSTGDIDDNGGRLNRATWDRMTIAQKAPRWLEQYQPTNGSNDAVLQLRETLRRHGLLRVPNSGQSNQASDQDSTPSDHIGAMQ